MGGSSNSGMMVQMMSDVNGNRAESLSVRPQFDQERKLTAQPLGKDDVRIGTIVEVPESKMNLS